MAFRFTLATVLRLREIAEEREERLLGQIQQQIGMVRENLTHMAARRVEIQQEREAELRARTSAALLQSSYAQIAALDLARQQAEEKLTKLEALRSEQMKIYTNAHRNRELLADMRETQHGEFVAARALREQKTMDDNFMSRRGR